MTENARLKSQSDILNDVTKLVLLSYCFKYQQWRWLLELTSHSCSNDIEKCVHPETGSRQKKKKVLYTESKLISILGP